ncbi:hypothetical protein ACM14_24530 [Delftia sp. JD2]|nr:hypothetical protein ACM14_24530 [Delftia sp. JD2]
MDLMANARDEVRQHWDQVADSIKSSGSSSRIAMNKFLMSLPFLLESDKSGTAETGLQGKID